MGPGAGRHQGRAQAEGMGGGVQGPPGWGADRDPGVPAWQVGTGSIAPSPARLLSLLLQGYATWSGTLWHTAWRSRTCAGTGTQSRAPSLVRHAGCAATSWCSHGRDEACRIQGTHGCRRHIWIQATGIVQGCVFPPLLPWAVACHTCSRHSLSCSTCFILSQELGNARPVLRTGLSTQSRST